MAEQLRGENPLGFPVELPIDVVAAAAFEEDAEMRRSSPYDALPEGWLGLDIGPETRESFAGELAAAKTIFWNGPMGVFEWPRFAEGTKAVAEAVAGSDAFSVVGGADSVRALKELGLLDQVSWVSTGGGAALELLEGKELPGVRVIPAGERVLIAGTGRCTRGRAETREFCAAFRPPDGVEVVICPPFGSLEAAVASGLTIFAQNVHWEDEGAFTGEVSAPMLLELGVPVRSSATPSGASTSARPTRRCGCAPSTRSRPACA